MMTYKTKKNYDKFSEKLFIFLSENDLEEYFYQSGIALEVIGETLDEVDEDLSYTQVVQKFIDFCLLSGKDTLAVLTAKNFFLKTEKKPLTNV